jgi:hypothetical protein
MKINMKQIFPNWQDAEEVELTSLLAVGTAAVLVGVGLGMATKALGLAPEPDPANVRPEDRNQKWIDQVA